MLTVLHKFSVTNPHEKYQTAYSISLRCYYLIFPLFRSVIVANYVDIEGSLSLSHLSARSTNLVRRGGASLHLHINTFSYTHRVRVVGGRWPAHHCLTLTYMCSKKNNVLEKHKLNVLLILWACSNISSSSTGLMLWPVPVGCQFSFSLPFLPFSFAWLCLNFKAPNNLTPLYAHVPSTPHCNLCYALVICGLFHIFWWMK